MLIAIMHARWCSSLSGDEDDGQSTQASEYQ
jgi:hypothetical protein